jgi:hypothetical protein
VEKPRQRDGLVVTIFLRNARDVRLVGRRDNASENAVRPVPLVSRIVDKVHPE